MSENSRGSDIKRDNSLESNKDKSSNPKKAGTNIATNVGTSTGAFMAGKTSVAEMKSRKKNHLQLHDSDSDADEDWVNFVNSRARIE